MSMLKRMDVRTASGGGNVIFPLSTLPPGTRIRELRWDVQVGYTKSSGDTLVADQFALWISNLRIGQYVNIPGPELQALVKQMLGRRAAAGADITAGTTTGTARFQVVVPFRDPRQSGAEDGSFPAEMLQGESAVITLAAANVHGVGTLAANPNGFQLALVADFIDGSGVPQVCQIGYLDPGGQTFEVPAGAYKDLLLLKAGMTATISEAEISSVIFSGDGEQILDNVPSGQLIQAFNTQGVRDSASEITIGTADRVPLTFVEWSGKGNISKQPLFESRGRIQMMGSLQSCRVVYWRAMQKDQGVINTAVMSTAAASPTIAGSKLYEPQTASKYPLRTLQKGAQSGVSTKKGRMLATVLPGKVRSTATPASS